MREQREGGLIAVCVPEETTMRVGACCGCDSYTDCESFVLMNSVAFPF